MTVSKLFEYIINGSFIPHKFRKQEIKCLLHSHFSCLDNVTKCSETVEKNSVTPI